MVATHHGFNVLKILGANGTITVRCNEKDALRSVEHVYCEATTMFPADEDLVEHSGDLMRKKQLVSQEQADVKKASLEPLLSGSSGKKFAASASLTPSEDLVHLMLDMSIGGSCGTLREEAPVYPRALYYKEGPAPGWGLQKLCHHRGRAFSQIGKHARHLHTDKL
jgi:hypothetical protein